MPHGNGSSLNGQVQPSMSSCTSTTWEWSGDHHTSRSPVGRRRSTRSRSREPTRTTTMGYHHAVAAHIHAGTRRAVDQGSNPDESDQTGAQHAPSNGSDVAPSQRIEGRERPTIPSRRHPYQPNTTAGAAAVTRPAHSPPRTRPDQAGAPGCAPQVKHPFAAQSVVSSSVLKPQVCYGLLTNPTRSAGHIIYFPYYTQVR